MTIEITTTAKLHHATRAKADKLAAMLQAEYPALALRPVYNEDESAVTGWIVEGNDEGSDPVEIYEGAKVPEIADLLDACEEFGIDPEAGAEDEDERPASVVPEGYRIAYREQTNTSGQTCGDWLAMWLETECHGIEGFDRIAFGGILISNAVDQSGKWARLPESGQKGWIGRWRMNGRQQIEKTVALTGVLRDAHGTKQDIPEDVLADLRSKHRAAIEKAAKAQAKAEKQAA